ncbi:cell death protein hid [Drosophila madeirensis]|uniref:Cell death protein hid n=1 Tax=Drosophila madeirensis TaxID=30013 RepID=A0AAU9FPL3_DROMD
MAVPFYLPEGGADDIASSGASGSSSGASSSGASTSSAGSSDGASSIASQSPNTTTSATQTPMQSPLPTDQVLYALCEWVRLYHSHSQQNNSAPHIFQYPPPPSPSCNYTGGDVFFPHGPPSVPPRTPHTSGSYAAGEEYNFFRQQTQPPYPAPSTPQPMPPQPPQSAPPMHYSHSFPQQSPHLLQHHHPASVYGMGQQHQPGPGSYYATYTPPPTPNTANAGTSTSSAAFGWHTHGPQLASTPLSAPMGSKMRLQRSQSDAARRKRLTSTGEDEREYQSDHETSWDDEYDDRYDNFTAGRERLQEFNGRIPPRKKKNKCSSSNNSASHSHSNNSSSSNSQRERERERLQRAEAEKKKPQSFTWPTVVTVFVLAMGCGFFAAR